MNQRQKYFRSIVAEVTTMSEAQPMVAQLCFKVPSTLKNYFANNNIKNKYHSISIIFRISDHALASKTLAARKCVQPKRVADLPTLHPA